MRLFLVVFKQCVLGPLQIREIDPHNRTIISALPQHSISLVVKLDKAGWPSMDIKYDLRLPMQIQCREKTFKERINQKATGISFQWF